jgi:hypothetical protein
MKSSNGTIPAGLTLYTFEYPEGWRDTRDPEQCHLQNDAEAVLFAKDNGAIKAVNIMTGAVVFTA